MALLPRSNAASVSDLWSDFGGEVGVGAQHNVGVIQGFHNIHPRMAGPAPLWGSTCSVPIPDISWYDKKTAC